MPRAKRSGVGRQSSAFSGLPASVRRRVLDLVGPVAVDSVQEAHEMARLLPGVEVVCEDAVEAGDLGQIIRFPGLSTLRVVGVAGAELDETLKAFGHALRKDRFMRVLRLSILSHSPVYEVAIAAGLKENRTLRELTLFRATNHGAAALGATLNTNRTLKRLTLDDSRIGPDGAGPLAVGLGANHCLEQLSLANSPGCGSATAVFLANALAVNTTLRELDLSMCEVDEDGVQALANVLATENNALKLLGLNACVAGDVGGEALGFMLRNNVCLTSLDVNNSSFTQRGIRALAEGLTVNTALLELDLSSNSLKSDGAAALAEALAQNSTLTDLRIEDCSVRQRGINALSEALAINKSLKSLNLNHNDRIEDSGALAVAHALKSNVALTSLALVGCEISKGGADQFAKSLARNVTLKRLNISENHLNRTSGKALLAVAKQKRRDGFLLIGL